MGRPCMLMVFEVDVTDGSTQIDIGDLDNVVLRVPEGQANFDLNVAVTSTEPSNEDSETSYASATVVVDDVNDGPVGVDDDADTLEDNSVIIDLTDNDTDLDGDSLTVTQIDGVNVEAGDTVDVGNGSVTMNDDGTVTFTPDGDYSGTETFEYTVSDGTETATATANGRCGS